MIINWSKFTVVLMAVYFCGSLHKIGEKLECLLSLIKLMSEAITFKSGSKRNTCVSSCYGKKCKSYSLSGNCNILCCRLAIISLRLHIQDFALWACEMSYSRNNWMHAYFTQFCFQFQFCLIFYTLSTVHFFIPIHSTQVI